MPGQDGTDFSADDCLVPITWQGQERSAELRFVRQRKPMHLLRKQTGGKQMEINDTVWVKIFKNSITLSLRDSKCKLSIPRAVGKEMRKR